MDKITKRTNDGKSNNKQKRLKIVQITISAAKKFINNIHRHQLSGMQKPPQGAMWAHAVALECGTICGVCLVGRPVSRYLDDGFTAEVTRVATDGTPNACSALYGVASRAARIFGFKRLLTYIHEEEPGTSLVAAGWVMDKTVKGQKWDRPSRRRSNVIVTNRTRWWTQWSDIQKNKTETEA